MRSSKRIARTSALLALTLVFQALRLLPFIGNMPYSTIIIGSLVNMCLYLSVLLIGESSAGMLIGVCAPVAAFFQGHLAFVALIPFVAIGNAVLVVCFYYLQKANKYAAVAAASVAKWGVMYLSARYLLHLFVKTDYDRLKIIIAGFNLPQLITAVIGGALALVLYRLLPKNIRGN